MIPSIPFLAEGGIVTGPTLAMIGEGANDEAVIPRPKGMRDGMLGGGGGATEVRIVLEGDDDLVRLFRRGIADRGGDRSEAHTSDLNSLMSISNAVFRLDKTKIRFACAFRARY